MMKSNEESTLHSIIKHRIADLERDIALWNTLPYIALNWLSLLNAKVKLSLLREILDELEKKEEKIYFDDIMNPSSPEVIKLKRLLDEGWIVAEMETMGPPTQGVYIRLEKDKI